MEDRKRPRAGQRDASNIEVSELLRETTNEFEKKIESSLERRKNYFKGLNETSWRLKSILMYFSCVRRIP